MTLFDRYLLRTFVKVLAVSFLSLTGLFIIIDLFGNLEEFISYAEREGSLLRVLFGYYGARVLSFFDRISGLLALIAAIFTITWFRRTNELTAVMAAGIPKARIVRPLVAATVIVALLAAANREVGLPQVRDKLSRNAQDWLGESAKRLTPRRDNQTQILITGKATVAAHRQINQPSFRLPNSFVEFGRQLVARQATYQPATDQHAGGYLLEGVTQPANLAEIPSARQDGKPVILSPKDNPWLKPGECFVASEITFEHLAADVAWCQFHPRPSSSRCYVTPVSITEPTRGSRSTDGSFNPFSTSRCCSWACRWSCHDSIATSSSPQRSVCSWWRPSSWSNWAARRWAIPSWSAQPWPRGSPC
jgi:lipopolysaccharide export system permease protein